MLVLEPPQERVVLVPGDDRRWTTTRRSDVVAAVTAAAIVVASAWWGAVLQDRDPEIKLGAAPLVGRNEHDGWDFRLGLGLAVALLVVLIVVTAVARGWLWRLRLRVVLPLTSAAATAFGSALALTDGADGLLHGAAHPTEYVAGLDAMPPAGEFVRTFTERLDDYSVHVRGHPPGFVLVLKAMAAVGLDGAWPAALLSLASLGLLVGAVLVTVWAVAGHDWVRRTAPLLVLAPFALWLITSADSFFAAVGASGTALVALALRTTRWRTAVLGAAGGLLLGFLLYLTYLGAVFAVVPLALIVRAAVTRRPSTVATMLGVATGALAVVVGFLLAGFWWLDGARRTRIEYWEGTAQFREWAYFALANLAVALIALGPAVVIGLVRLHDRAMWWLVGGGVVALFTSHLSQYTRGEVERIWLPFYPWLLVASAVLVSSRAGKTGATWVGLQGAFAIGLQAILVSKW